MNTKIILVIEGGLVQEIIANSHVEVLTIDHDVEGGDQESIREIPRSDMSAQKCYVRFEDVTLDPPRLAKLWRIACQDNSLGPNEKDI